MPPFRSKDQRCKNLTTYLKLVPRLILHQLSSNILHAICVLFRYRGIAFPIPIIHVSVQSCRCGMGDPSRGYESYISIVQFNFWINNNIFRDKICLFITMYRGGKGRRKKKKKRGIYGDLDKTEGRLAIEFLCRVVF